MATRAAVGIAPSSSIQSPAALLFGAVFVLLGLLGFTVSGGHHPAGQDGGDLLGLFQVNVLHNLVHLGVGAIMIATGILGSRPAKIATTAFGAVYLVLFGAGLLVIGTAANVLALNGADNVLHLALGVALVGVGLAGDRLTARS